MPSQLLAIREETSNRSGDQLVHESDGLESPVLCCAVLGRLGVGQGRGGDAASFLGAESGGEEKGRA